MLDLKQSRTINTKKKYGLGLLGFNFAFSRLFFKLQCVWAHPSLAVSSWIIHQYFKFPISKKNSPLEYSPYFPPTDITEHPELEVIHRDHQRPPPCPAQDRVKNSTMCLFPKDCMFVHICFTAPFHTSKEHTNVILLPHICHRSPIYKPSSTLPTYQISMSESP